MKRMTILSILFLLLFSATVFAEDCTVSELGVTVSLPDDYSIMTRETVKNGSLPDDMGMSLDMMYDYLVENQIYIHAVSADYTAELMLTSNTTNHNLFGLSESSLELVAEQLTKEYEAEATSVRKATVYMGESNHFIVFRFTDGGIQYYTAKDGQAYQLTMHPSDGSALTEAQEAELKEAADSMKLSGMPQTYATEVPPDLESIEGERPVSPFAAVGVFVAIIAVSIIVLLAMKPKKKK